jgi:SAM-dependent methyltransferase
MSQITASSSNNAQIEYWNSSSGETWAQFQEPLDRQIEPLGLAAIDVLKPREGQHIVDIGCGCGQTTLSLASRVGVTGSVMGVDISKPMLEVALRRPRPAPNLPVTFRQFDAQTDDLGHYLFDAAFSRFVMFFSEPATAFANIPYIAEAWWPACLRLLASSQREPMDGGTAPSGIAVPTTR